MHKTAHPQGRLQRILAMASPGFPLLDAPVQAMQGLTKPLQGQVWPTRVDLVDVILRLNELYTLDEGVMNFWLLALTAGCLALYPCAYTRLTPQGSEPR